ncbi:MAG: peptidase M48, partial [Rhodospirillales bacterium]|nr:peptidase M48 [Rhodospirillales bacterium]
MMFARRSWLVRGGALLIALLVLGGCAVNPATGERMVTLGTTLEDEHRIGLREHPRILKEFGGVYSDTKVTAYVARIGAQLAAASELPRISWRFTVLNSEQI